MILHPFLLIVALAFGVAAHGAPAAEVSAPDFSRDVRPVLSENCLACHGHDPQKRKANLRLDVRDVAARPAKSGAIAIVPGKPNESELVKRITAANPDDRMPPASSHKVLRPAQIDTLRRWVAAGAPYEAHWAFVAPVRPAEPAVKEPAWCRNAIDRFIMGRLEADGLRPSPEADKVTLLRRLYLDLIGLPPSIEQVDEFLKDNSADAYEKQVEKLLASPHYGERWGRHWLDAARYADSDGFEKDKARQMYFYRDYVINAFNRDQPYDQFIIEQIAGDELPNATQDQIVATGFLRNSMLNEEGGVDPEQFRMDEMYDRMDAIGKSMLGLTIQCGQCHSHKFDPLTQEEYYRLFAFLNNDHESQPVVYTPDEQLKIGNLTREMREIEARLRGQTPDWKERIAAWEEHVAHDQPEWMVLHLEPAGEADQRYLRRKDDSLVAQGYAPTKFTHEFTAKTDVSGITAFRLELLTDLDLPRGGPGRSIHGGCALTEFIADVAPEVQPEKKSRVKISDASSDFDQPVKELEPMFYDKTDRHRQTGPVKFAIDGDDLTAWGIDAGWGRRNTDRKAVFNCEKPVDIPNGAVLTFSLKQDHGGWNSDDNQNNNLGRFRISVTTDKGKVVADPLPKRVREILAIPRERRTERQISEIFSYWRTTVPEWKEADDRIDALWGQWPAGATSLTLTPREQGRETHVLVRGDWLKPEKLVTPGVPAFLHQLPDKYEPTRLTLARWLADRKSPTTARAFVNRMWQHYFGTGIVSTVEDFGYQGDPPSYPRLLDWLACEFMDSGWSIKHVQRLIVTSATYRQSSRVTADQLDRDPSNRLLARGPRFRVDGEIIRDIALASSGLLDDQVGGRSVMPPAPAFLFVPPASYGPFPWIDDPAPLRYRRAIYTFRRRSTPYPVLQTFDVPNADASCVRRQRSNSPLQALTTLNESIFVDCARALALRTLKDGGENDSDRVNWAFRTVLARTPTEAEKSELLSLLEKQRRRISDGWLNAAQIVSGKNDPPRDLPSGITPTQWAAYTVVSRVLLNLDETITKE